MICAPNICLQNLVVGLNDNNVYVIRSCVGNVVLQGKGEDQFIGLLSRCDLCFLISGFCCNNRKAHIRGNKGGSFVNCCIECFIFQCYFINIILETFHFIIQLCQHSVQSCSLRLQICIL